MASFRLSSAAILAGYRLQSFDAVGSTNTEAMNAASVGDPGKVWFVAREQTAGRGRRGRPWSSQPGNLATSLLLPPQPDATRAATLGFVAGVALHAALTSILPDLKVRTGLNGANATAGDPPARIALKWPNDVLLDGAKLAGISLEARKLPDGTHSVVIGIGVNVASAPEGLPYPAASLAALGTSLDAEAVFEALSASWVDTFALWNGGEGIPALLERWRAAAAGIGSSLAVNQNGEAVRGIFETIDSEGRLIVRKESGVRVAITAGDVHFGVTASLAGGI